MGQFKAMATVTMYGPQPVGELGRRLGLSELAASLREGREGHALRWLGALSDDELDALTRGYRGLLRVAAETAAQEAAATPPAGTAVRTSAMPVSYTHLRAHETRH